MIADPEDERVPEVARECLAALGAEGLCQRIVECGFLTGTHSAEGIMASGHASRIKGQTHGCSDQTGDVQKVLANTEPSTHGTSATLRSVAPTSDHGAKADPKIRRDQKLRGS